LEEARKRFIRCEQANLIVAAEGSNAFLFAGHMLLLLQEMGGAQLFGCTQSNLYVG